MELSVADLELTRLLRESGRSRSFEAVATRDGHEVIAKVFDIADESVEPRVEHEFRLIQALDIEGVVKAESLHRVGDKLVLVLERTPGLDLERLCRGEAVSLDRFWTIAVQVAEILAKTHARRVIHRDIKPANLLFDPDTGRAHIADFGISVLLEDERRHIYDDQVLAGTLPYIAPEQTGRTNRGVDFRSDLYSLGVTFYELLTGQRPFSADSPLELIHAHLARSPVPPRQLRGELPEALSRLVMKLLAKAPEQRYQTAAGLAADLRLLRDGAARNEELANFALGEHERAHSLQLPSSIYGRQVELEWLTDMLEQTFYGSSRSTVFVSAAGGMGKSALLAQLELASLGYGGYILRGVFEAEGVRPCAGFIDAFTGLFEQLLTESEVGLRRWRRRLLAELGPLSEVACAQIPTLSAILGPQASPAELGPIENRNRLHLTFERLIACICAGGPLLITLNDLHLADHGSISLLESLCRGEGGPLLICASVHEGALPQGHPLTQLLAEREALSLRSLELRPLEPEAIEQLVRETLSLGAEPAPANFPELDEFVAQLVRRTGCVPRVFRQLLELLLREGHLQREQGRWRWEPQAVENASLSEDAVEMMRARLEQLEPAEREVLARAACLGPRFDLPQLAFASQLAEAELAGHTYTLVERGLLTAPGSEFRFPHESVRQAAREGQDPELIRETHWRVGQRLLAQLGEAEGEPVADGLLYEVVDHLNRGRPEALGEAQGLELARLDARVGQDALGTAAYELALRYFERGLELAEGVAALPAELEFELRFGRAHALALVGEARRADGDFEALLDRAGAFDEQQFGRLIATRLRLLQFENRQGEAVELGREALAKLGAPLPNKVALPQAIVCVTRAWLQTRKLELDAAMQIPACEGAREITLVDIVAQLKYPAFVVNNDLFVYLSGLHVLLLREHGFHETTPVALSDLGVAVSGGFDNPAEGVRLVDMALASCARVRRPKASRANIQAIGGCLANHRGRGFGTFLDQLAEDYVEALELGEFDHASFMGAFALDMRLDTGTHLAVLERQARAMEVDNDRRRARQMMHTCRILSYTCSELLGTRAPGAEQGEQRRIADLDDAGILASEGVETNVYTAKTNRCLAYLVLDQPQAALREFMDGVGRMEEVLFNAWFVARFYVVGCVAVECVRQNGEALPKGASAAARRGLKLLRSWAKGCPENYGHHLELALGMRELGRGREARALTHLERAWEGARTHGCRFVEGLAAEQVALALERAERTILVEGAWQRVWDAYAAWGAEAKLERLRLERPEQFVLETRSSSSTTSQSLSSISNGGTDSRSRTSSQVGDGGLDFEAALRSVGVISQGLALDEVIARVLEAALTNGGADHALLLLERGGEVFLVARTGTEGGGCEQVVPPLVSSELGDRGPATVVNFVARTGKPLVIDELSADPRFAADPYLARTKCRSLVAMPMFKNGLLGVLVLENRLSASAFPRSVLEILELIVGQAASTLDNARLHEALHRSEARWRSLVDGAPDLIGLLDDRARLLFLNREEPDEQGETAFTRAMLPDSRARWQTSVQAVLDSRQAIELELELDIEQLHADSGLGQWYAARVASIELAEPTIDEQEAASSLSQARRAVFVATNISARKRAEFERKQLEAQLRQQQRLESLGVLASGVAHEINNPVQGIMSYAELLAAEADDKATVLEFAAEIGHEADRVATIVRNLLHFSRHERKQEFEPTKLSALIEGTVSLVRAILRKDQIALNIDIDDAALHCRIQQIQQIIMNLVTNARDALNERYPKHDERKRISISARACSDRQVELVVEDSGGGIPEHVLAHIFDPFFTTKSRDKGTGLGLAVSHGIAQEHHGELLVETEAGVGTRFRLVLPTNPDAPSGAPAAGG